MSQSEPCRQWDVIVVGSGMTGMSFALQVLTQHPEKRVLVLEKHYLAGGYATSFELGDSVCDCSLHKLAGLKTGNTRRILESLGIFEDLNIKYHTSYFAVRHRDELFELPNEPEGFATALKRRFPEEAAGIDRFMEDITVHGKNGYHQFRMMSGEYVPDLKSLRYAHKNYKTLSVLDALNQRFKSPLLREICGAPTIYAGGLSEDLSYLYYLHILYASLVCGTGYVKGGAQFLSDTLIAHIRRRNGCVRLKTSATKILIDEHGTACGVMTKYGPEYATDVVLNCSPHYAFSSLIPETHRPARVLEALDRLRPSWATTTLYLELAAPPEELGVPDEEVMLFADDPDLGARNRAELRDTAAYEAGFWEHAPMMITNYHGLDANGGKIVCLNVLDSPDHWPLRREREYKLKKVHCADVLLARFRRAFPLAASQISRMNLATPRTYERYTNNFKGAGYGAMVGTDISGHSFHYNMTIKRLHFMSSWVAGPSYEAAMGYAEMRSKYFFSERAARSENAAP